MIRRSPSLFVTFGIAFFAFLLVAILLHQWFLTDLIRPLVIGWERDRVEMVAEAARDELAARYGDLEDAGIEEILRRHGREIRGLHLVLWRKDAPILANHALPPMMRRGLLRHLEDADWRTGLPRPGPRHRWLLDMPERKERQEVFSRIDLEYEGQPVGHLLAILPPGLSGPPPEHRHNPRFLLLLLPLALLLAGLAGLLVFHLLTRRLQALENLAGRISKGDLTARVKDLGRDEIGRLGHGLNEMAANLGEAQGIIADNDRQRRRLLADISHELATPLTSIRGYTETLLNPEVPVSQAERNQYLERVCEESQRMQVLIDDVLELSRLESGSMPLQKERLDWVALCRHTVARFREQFAVAGLELTMADTSAESGQDKELWIVADGRRMEQVVENLLQNALRYVPAGGRVVVTLAGKTDGPFQLTVSDNGPGFADQDLPHVFDRFYRADAARSRQGSGLGLAIVREIVAQHGGLVVARNLAGGGAALEVVLPTADLTD